MAFRDAVGWWWVALAGGGFMNALILQSGLHSMTWVVLGGMFLAVGLVFIGDLTRRRVTRFTEAHKDAIVIWCAALGILSGIGFILTVAMGW